MDTMEKTPCVRCVKLIRRPNENYDCDATGKPLDNDIVYGTIAKGLPACPFFVDAASGRPYDKLVDFDLRLNPLVASGARRKRRRNRKPEAVMSNADRKAQLIEVIKSYRSRKGRWPSHTNIYFKSGLLSAGFCYTLLKEMIQDGTIVKEESVEGKRQFVYRLVG